MKSIYSAILALWLVACGESTHAPASVSEPVAAVAKQSSFEKQVFVFTDAFNAQMRAIKSPLAIAGAEIKDETLQAGNSKVVAITPHLQVNWLSNASGSDIDTVLMTHQVHAAPQDEFVAINALLVTQSSMTPAQVEQFYALFAERIQRLMQMRKLDKPSDITQTEFEFAGYRWQLGMGQQHNFYARHKIDTTPK